MIGKLERQESEKCELEKGRRGGKNLAGGARARGMRRGLSLGKKSEDSGLSRASVDGVVDSPI